MYSFGELRMSASVIYIVPARRGIMLKAETPTSNSNTVAIPDRFINIMLFTIESQS